MDHRTFTGLKQGQILRHIESGMIVVAVAWDGDELVVRTRTGIRSNFCISLAHHWEAFELVSNGGMIWANHGDWLIHGQGMSVEEFRSLKRCDIIMNIGSGETRTVIRHAATNGYLHCENDQGEDVRLHEGDCSRWIKVVPVSPKVGHTAGKRGLTQDEFDALKPGDIIENMLYGWHLTVENWSGDLLNVTEKDGEIVQINRLNHDRWALVSSASPLGMPSLKSAADLFSEERGETAAPVQSVMDRIGMTALEWNHLSAGDGIQNVMSGNIYYVVGRYPDGSLKVTDGKYLSQCCNHSEWRYLRTPVKFDVSKFVGLGLSGEGMDEAPKWPASISPYTVIRRHTNGDLTTINADGLDRAYEVFSTQICAAQPGEEVSLKSHGQVIGRVITAIK